MTVPAGTNWNVSDDNLVGERIRALREALGMTQEGMAAKSGGVFERVNVTRLERGYNAATSWAQRVGLSKAFELDVWDVDAYLTGALSLAQVLERRSRPAERSAPRDPVVIPDDRYPSRAEVLAALSQFIDPAARERVASQANFGARDPGALYWIEALARAQRDVELERAGARNVEREAGEREFDELADRDEARAAAARAAAEAARDKRRRR
jgi:transcriptional regulator with XRE-family HTH domain